MCNKIVKNIKKSSNMSKTRCKTAQNYVKLSTNHQKCQIIVKNVEKLWYNRKKNQETVKIHPEM